jgi:hypothetical protein
MNEEWRTIPGHEGFYEVSDHGRLRGVDRHVEVFDRRCTKPRRFFRPGKLLKPTLTKSGHLDARLGLRARGLVHNLVLEAFVGPCPEGMEACHLNDVPDDNRLANLRWGTRSDNMRDRVRNGKHHNANKTHCKHGHEFTPENTYPQPSGRACRTCRRIESQRRKAKLRELRKNESLPRMEKP